MNGAGVDCQWDYVDMHEGRYAGPSLQHTLVCANDEDRSWPYGGIKIPKRTSFLESSSPA